MRNLDRNNIYTRWEIANAKLQRTHLLPRWCLYFVIYHPENRWFQNCGSFVLAEFDTPDLTFTVRVNFQDYKETNDGAINFGFKSVLFPIQAALTEFTIG